VDGMQAFLDPCPACAGMVVANPAYASLVPELPTNQLYANFTNGGRGRSS